MDEGQRINITFLHFDVWEQPLCSNNWVELNYDNFISRHCGKISEPWTIITNTNTLTVTFRSIAGFLAVWTATNEPPTYPPATAGCHSCTFPFEFGDGTFESCISVHDVDTQPWCSTGPPSTPTDEGTHIFTPPKVTCSESDSSCPSSPSQTVISSPEYPLEYPNDADQVKCINRNHTYDIKCFYLYRP